jgi:hypothetical protein
VGGGDRSFRYIADGVLFYGGGFKLYVNFMEMLLYISLGANWPAAKITSFVAHVNRHEDNLAWSVLIF